MQSKHHKAIDKEFDLVVRNGSIVSPTNIFDADIGIKEGKIVSISNDLNIGKRDIDATGKYVLPGGVDTHCHIEQISGNGLKNADSFETATRSAAFGGTTSVISFAAQHKGQKLKDVVAEYEECAVRGSLIDYAFHIIVSDVDTDSLVNELLDLSSHGHRSIKIFTTYNIRLADEEILEVMSAAKKAGCLICVHAENHAIIDYATQESLKAGNIAPKFHAIAHSRLAEAEAVSRIIRFSEFIDQSVLLFHISTTEGVNLVREARARNSKIIAETCPHYLLMTEEDLNLPGLEGAKFMCSPPQRRTTDQEALWQGLKYGDLSLVTSDHAPFRYDDTGKLANGPNPPFNKIANGMPGLEVRLPLLFNAMVSEQRFDICKFVEVTSTNPARIFGLKNKGQISLGKDADLVIWDADKKFTYGKNDLHDNVGYNPYEGRNIVGWPEMVISRGDVIVENETISHDYGRGTRMHIHPMI